LSGADVFCLPSRFEGLPLALLEALAAGLPVCATRIDGVADVVVDGSEAVLVAPDDHGELADGLRRLLGDPVLRQRLGGAGRELACSRYRFDRMMDSLEALYRADGVADQRTLP
jgi:glycosyltransferase involved in cell wall biosynthesis